MFPIMPWDVLPGYTWCVGYAELARSSAESVKGSAKRTLRRKELWSTWDKNSCPRGLIMGAPRVLDSHGSFNFMLVFSIPGAAAQLQETPPPFPSPEAAPQPRLLRGAEREQPELAGAKAVLLCPRAAFAGPPLPSAYMCPPHHTKGEIIVIKNKSSSLSIDCTYWPLLPSSQMHLQHAQKPSACLFSHCCSAWSRDKCIPCYSLPLQKHL